MGNESKAMAASQMSIEDTALSRLHVLVPFRGHSMSDGLAFISQGDCSPWTAEQTVSTIPMHMQSWTYIDCFEVCLVKRIGTRLISISQCVNVQVLEPDHLIILIQSQTEMLALCLRSLPPRTRNP